jgi:antirestriction protein ArdC
MSASAVSTDAQASQRDHRQEVTDSIIAMLEKGLAPWQKPWEGAAMPFNPTTEKPYRGGNTLHLMATALSRGYEDPRWMTYKQAAERGWQVRKGERGTHIEYWEAKDQSRRESTEPDQGGATKDKSDRRLIHRVFTVFNAKQIEGVPVYTRPERSVFEAVQSGERILTNSGARIAHDQGDRSFYNRLADSIHLPPKEAFKDAPGYYGTALHELAHWTGHPSRLNRSTLNDSYRFGDLNYAKEELRAELASVFLAAERGIPHDPVQHAAYVGSWVKALREDKNEVFRAAHDASVATDFVLALDREISRAEAIEAADPTGQALDDPARVGAQEETIREEIGTLEAGREQSKNGTPVADQTPRENSEVVARFEADSSTIAVHAKLAATDHHVAVDTSAPTPASGNSKARSELSASFTAAKEVTAKVLGESARTFTAETESGVYNGRIIGETDLHIVQRISGQTAIAHMKRLFDSVPPLGSHVGITYTRDLATVRDPRERAQTQELGR